MAESISTYLWPGPTHFGFGAVGQVGQEARALRANSVFILTDPGIISARLLEPVIDSLDATRLPYTCYAKIPANPDIGSVDAATAATGMDALSHCIEAYVSTKQNPALDPMILYGIELIGGSLRLAVAQPSNRTARRDMMLASMIAGIVISSKWLGACHSLAHQLSSFTATQPGVAIALMLPYQMAFSLPGAIERSGDIGAALEGLGGQGGSETERGRREWAERAVTAVEELIGDIGLPSRLHEVGLTEEMIPPMAENAYHLDGNWPTNRGLVGEADFKNLYQQAF